MDENRLLECFSCLINSLPALQLAVSNGFGGRDAPDKVAWLPHATLQWLKENDDVYPDELEDMLAELLNAEFDIVYEDGSLRGVSAALLRAYASARSGNWSAVQQVCAEFSQRRAPTVRAAEHAADSEESASESESSGPDEQNDEANVEDGLAPALEPLPQPSAAATATASTSSSLSASTSPSESAFTSIASAGAHGAGAVFDPMQLDAEASAAPELAASVDGDADWTIVARKQPRRPNLPR